MPPAGRVIKSHTPRASISKRAMACGAFFALPHLYPHPASTAASQQHIANSVISISYISVTAYECEVESPAPLAVQKAPHRSTMAGRAGAYVFEDSSTSNRVVLNVYDLSTDLAWGNWYAYRLGMGVFHAGVEVYGVEYAFGGHDADASGVFATEPRDAPGQGGTCMHGMDMRAWTKGSPGQGGACMHSMYMRVPGRACGQAQQGPSMCMHCRGRDRAGACAHQGRSTVFPPRTGYTHDGA